MEEQIEPSEIFLTHFEEKARENPGHVAIQFKDQCLTYQELDERANQFAHYLLALRLPKSSLIANLQLNTPESIICQFAIWKAGHAFINLSPTESRSAIRFKLKDSQVKVVITTTMQYEKISSNLKLISYETFLRSSDVYSKEKPNITLSEDDLAYVIYTSGTTGMYKGVAINHCGLVPCMRAHEMILKPFMHDKDVMAQLAQCGFDASIAEMLILGLGGTLAIVPDEIRKNSAELIHYYREQGITIGIFTPEHLKIFDSVENLAALRAIFIVGEYFSKEFAKQWKTKANQVINGYGLTETTICVSLQEVTPLTFVQRGRIPLGDVVPGSSWLVEDEELYVGGKCLARGYIGHAQNNNEQCFVTKEGERYYKTGDKVKQWYDGSIEFLGRSDRQIKVRGQRIDLDNLGVILRRHKEINAAVVDGELNCYLVLKSPTKLIQEIAVREYAAKQLACGVTLREIHFCSSLPTNNQMKKNLALRTSRKRTYSKNETGIAKVLAEAWRSVLNIEKDKQIALENNFYHFGGNSLKLEALRGILHEKLNVNITVDHLIRFQTFGSQIRLIKILQNHTNVIKTLSDQGDAPNLFCVHSLLGKPELDYASVVKHSSWNLYGLSLENFATDNLIPEDIESFAECYALAIYMVQPVGPYYIAGLSIGAAIAVATAQVLEDLGCTVYVHLLDGFNPMLIKKLSVEQHATLLDVLSSNLHCELSDQEKMLLNNCEDKDMQVSAFAEIIKVKKDIDVNIAFIENLLNACLCYDPDYSKHDMTLYKSQDSLINEPNLGWLRLRKIEECEGNHFDFMTKASLLTALQKNLNEQYRYQTALKTSQVVVEFLQDYRNIHCVDLFCDFLSTYDASLSLKELVLSGCDFKNVNLSDADLQGTVLNEADFKGAVLLRTNLYRTSLLNAKNLTAVQLAAVKGINKTEADPTKGPPYQIDHDLLSEAKRIATKFKEYREDIQSGRNRAYMFFKYATDRDVKAFHEYYSDHLQQRYRSK